MFKISHSASSGLCTVALYTALVLTQLELHNSTLTDWSLMLLRRDHSSASMLSRTFQNYCVKWMHHCVIHCHNIRGVCGFRRVICKILFILLLRSSGQSFHLGSQRPKCSWDGVYTHWETLLWTVWKWLHGMKEKLWTLNAGKDVLCRPITLLEVRIFTPISHQTMARVHSAGVHLQLDAEA